MIILHGDDVRKSYQRLIDISGDYKSQGYELIVHDNGAPDITSVRQEMGSTGLFGISKCFIFKNFLSSSKSKNKDKVIALLNDSENQPVIFWDDKALSATILKPFPRAKVENFPISPVIFKFLDSLRPGNTKTILLSWKKILEEGTEPEFAFAMLCRQIKLLIQAKSGPSFLKLAPYPARLINAQATSFTLDHLLDLYERLYRIDVKIKTGATTVSLDQLLSHFLQKI